MSHQGLHTLDFSRWEIEAVNEVPSYRWFGEEVRGLFCIEKLPTWRATRAGGGVWRWTDWNPQVQRDVVSGLYGEAIGDDDSKPIFVSNRFKEERRECSLSISSDSDDAELDDEAPWKRDPGEDMATSFSSNDEHESLRCSDGEGDLRLSINNLSIYCSRCWMTLFWTSPSIFCCGCWLSSISRTSRAHSLKPALNLADGERSKEYPVEWSSVTLKTLRSLWSFWT